MILSPSPRPIPAAKNRQRWLKSFVQQGAQEDSTLEFKRGELINELSKSFQATKEPPKHGWHARVHDIKAEMKKDVSALANAAGGLIIYGIGESKGKDGLKTATSFEPVDLKYLQIEQIDQILSSIQPPVEAYIKEVKLGGDLKGGCCVLVEVPQSTTAHQAPDNKYYRRRFNTTSAMEHYEVVEVMNRAKHPSLEVTVIAKPILPGVEIHSVAISIKNKSSVMCLHWCVDVAFPEYVNDNWLSFGGSSPANRIVTEHGVRPTIRLSNAGGSPLLPGMEHNEYIDRLFSLLDLEVESESTDEIYVRVYADNSPPASHLIHNQVWLKTS